MDVFLYFPLFLEASLHILAVVGPLARPTEESGGPKGRQGKLSLKNREGGRQQGYIFYAIGPFYLFSEQRVPSSNRNRPFRLIPASLPCRYFCYRPRLV